MPHCSCQLSCSGAANDWVIKFSSFQSRGHSTATDVDRDLCFVLGMLVRASTIGLHMAKHFALEGHLPLDDRITKKHQFHIYSLFSEYGNRTIKYKTIKLWNNLTTQQQYLILRKLNHSSLLNIKIFCILSLNKNLLLQSWV